MRPKLSAGFLPLAILLTAVGTSFSQVDPVDSPDELLGQTKAITTAVPFLLISPDARQAALGDAGVASSPDANAAYWNPGKLVYIKNPYGGTLSYTPWLGKIINDMWISYLSGFYKISREQAIAIGFKYFDLGEIEFNTGPTQADILGRFNPKEFSFDFTYSRMLTEELGVGITGRYVHSNLTGAFSGGLDDAKPGNSAGADIGIFYSKDLKGARSSNLSLGAMISNIGAKLSYSDNSNKDFLPTNLRLGTAYKIELDPYNTFTFLFDINKLMVPSVDKDQSLLSGMFGSFGDAPGGFKEEMQEIMYSIGTEYWYHEIVALRLGYFLESYDKGNRKYLTAGVGFRKKAFGIDVAYLAPTNKREHPLAETLRFTVMLQIPDTSEIERTVTED